MRLQSNNRQRNGKQRLERARSRKYELVANSGLRSAKLYFNLGNACLQAEAFGKAVAYFEQARRFSPSDPDIAKNLGFAREKLGGGPSGPSFSEELAALNLGASSVAMWMLAVAWVGLWLCIGLHLWDVSVPFMKSICGGLVCALVVAALSVTFSIRHRASFNAVTVVENVRLHQSDGEVFGVVGELNEGQRVRIEQERGTWLKVQARDALDTTVSGWGMRDAFFRLRG